MKFSYTHDLQCWACRMQEKSKFTSQRKWEGSIFEYEAVLENIESRTSFTMPQLLDSVIWFSYSTIHQVVKDLQLHELIEFTGDFSKNGAKIWKVKS